MTHVRKQLVFISLEPWDDVWRRNQFVSRELAQRGWEILFVEPAADWSAGLRRRDWSQFERRPVWSPEGLPGIRVLRPFKVLPKSKRWGEAVNRRLWDRVVHHELKQVCWRNPYLWVNNQLLWSAAAGSNLGRWKRVLYDVTDDWSSAGGTEAWLSQVRRDDQAMSEVADAVVVCSESLAAARRGRYGRKLSLVPNGVDLEHFIQVDSLAVAPEIAALPDSELQMGYSGTIHPDRLDVDLVAAVAKARPGWSWVFIGPNHLKAQDKAKLDLPNVHLLGPRPYDELPKYLAGIDVCVTPHRVTPFTESLNPIKLWEYLAVGHPIVSTPVAGFRDFPGDVSLAKTAAEWIGAIEAIARRSESDLHMDRARRRERVFTDSWSARVDRLESILLGVPLLADTLSAPRAVYA